MEAQRHYVACLRLHSTAGFKPKAQRQHPGPVPLPTQGVLGKPFLHTLSLLHSFPVREEIHPHIPARGQETLLLKIGPSPAKGCLTGLRLDRTAPARPEGVFE